MPSAPTLSNDLSYGLIVRQQGKPQQILVQYVTLVLNYRYGLQVVVVDGASEGASLLLKHSGCIRCVFVIQNQKITSKTLLNAMSLMGKLPLFLLCPLVLLGAHTKVAEGMDNVVPCTWELAFKKTKSSQPDLIEQTLQKNSVIELLEEIDQVVYAELEQRVRERVQTMHTLPSMPEIVLRVMRLVNDPNSTAEQLEKVLFEDPAIVLKLLQTVNSPAFAGAGHSGEWTLKEAIVRLGMKKVGAIAQQIKMMNSFVQPQGSRFDLRRFWEHSLGCALLAEKIYTDKLIPLKTEIPFETYWLSAILHDIGKMVLGFFFWEHFQNVIAKMTASKFKVLSFHEAETQMGGFAHHERVGQLLLMKSGVRQELVEAVMSHHSVQDNSNELACLLNLVNNLSKDLGLGYLLEEDGVYSESLLYALKISEDDIQHLKEQMKETMVDQIKTVVGLCLSS